MIRWILLAVLVVALTATATVAIRFLPADATSALPVASGRDRTVPSAVVEESLVHNFGTMSQHSEGRHTWVVKNAGRADLELWKISSSCTCTLANLKEGQRAVVKPGQQIEILLEWQTKAKEGPFHTETIIGTNDPAHETLEFEIAGIVQPPFKIIPPGTAIDFQTVPLESSPHRSIGLVFPDRPQSRITSVTSSRPELVAVSSGPFTESERKDLQVDAGQRIDFQIHPRTELGEFREEVLVRTDHPKVPEVSLTVSGRVMGPISAVPDQVRAGAIPGRRGGSIEVTLWSRGQAEPTTYQVDQAPEKLQVKVEPVDEQPKEGGSTAKAHRSRLIVTVPPGTPPGVISSPIVLKTNHPQANRLSLPVRIVVTGGV